MPTIKYDPVICISHRPSQYLTGLDITEPGLYQSEMYLDVFLYITETGRKYIIDMRDGCTDRLRSVPLNAHRYCKVEGTVQLTVEVSR